MGRGWLALFALIEGCSEESGRTLPGVSNVVDVGVVEDTALPPVDANLPPGTLRVAALNLRRFFDTVCDSGMCTGADFEEKPTAAAFASRTDQIAKGLDALGASVITIEEIENQTCLDALKAKLPKLPTMVLGETDFKGSLDVAVLSAYPLLSVKKHRGRALTRPDGTTTSFTREFLEVHLDVKGKEVVAFATHFRSKAGTDDPGRRLAEGEAARAIVVEAVTENPKALYVLAGDFNDTPGSPPIAAIEKGGDLFRTSSALPESELGTYVFEGKPQAIDHVFVAKKGAGTYVDGSFRVVRGASAGGYAGSDHAAVVADFDAP